jgi:tRNA 2-thiouridine synthesizing protein A
MGPDPLPFDPDAGPDDDPRPLRQLRAVAGRPCSACGGRCSAFEAVWSITLGLGDAPRCLSCLGHGLGREPEDLLAQLTDYVDRRACYRRAWEEAGRLEANGPPCPVSAPTPYPGRAIELTPPEPAAEWDAGDLGCGDLVLALRARLAALPAGAVLRVRATDPAAPEDLPAWCRMTGHPLVSAAHPIYLIRRKGA